MLRLGRKFFSRKAEVVAKNLLGKILCRKMRKRVLKARIVETEAYYDERDPASRACKNGDLRETMKMPGGTILVYGVHNNWMMNIVTGGKGKAEAVLLRAVEPLNFFANTRGPGLLAKALKINKSFHKKDVCKNRRLWIEDSKTKIKISRSNRIGVRKDLKKKLRFYIKDNLWVSKK